jgi:hypothetical protein
MVDRPLAAPATAGMMTRGRREIGGPVDDRLTCDVTAVDAPRLFIVLVLDQQHVGTVVADDPHSRRHGRGGRLWRAPHLLLGRRRGRAGRPDRRGNRGVGDVGRCTTTECR